jgi:hypothetical protein
MMTKAALFFHAACAILLCACQSTPRPLLDSPQSAVDCMRDAYNNDDASLFIHTLSAPVLTEVSSHTIIIIWSEIRPRVGELVARAKIVEVADYTAPVLEPLPPANFVRPTRDRKLMRLVLELDGKRESVLFQREVDAAPPTAKQAKGFWIGDRYFVKSEHPSPDTYLVEDSPEKERTHWRLVFPYEPFQREGELSRMLQQKLAEKK